MGCRILTVSTDTKFTHLAWQREEKALSQVRFSMAADHTGRLARLFGVYEDSNGMALRGTFLIGPDGRLMNAEVNFFNLGRNIEELLRKFKANLYLSRKKDEACPSKWKEEGDKTLKPSAKLVGRVQQELDKK